MKLTLILGIGCCLLAECAISHADEPSPKLRLLVIAETADPDAGSAMAMDLQTVNTFFKTRIPEGLVDFSQLNGEDVTPDGIKNKISSIASDTNDTLFCYYSGHGRFSQEQNQHLLVTKDGTIPRSEVLDLLKGRNSRLTVFITDSCSGFEHSGSAPASVRDRRGYALEPPLFTSLFLLPTGVVDISSTKPGETALADIDTGAYFTRSFIYTLDSNLLKPITWDGVLRQASTQALTLTNGKQTAYAVSDLPNPDSSLPNPNQQLPQTPPEVPQRIRFGVRADRTERSAQYDGVEALEVFDNSAACRMQGPDGGTYMLEANVDIITHINSIPVRTNAEIVREVFASGDVMTVRVIDTRASTATLYNVQLSNSGVRSDPLGVEVDDVRTQLPIDYGVRVVSVFAGYPATRITAADSGGTYTIIPYRDVITAVNGNATNTPEDFAKELSANASTARLRIYDTFTKTESDYIASLLQTN